MVRKRGESGRYVESVTHDAVLGVFERVEGPVITSADVAEQLDCSADAARTKLEELHEEGRVGRRKTAGRLVYWLVDDHEQGAIDATDAFWDAEPGSSSEPTDASTVDDYVYGSVGGADDGK